MVKASPKSVPPDAELSSAAQNQEQTNQRPTRSKMPKDKAKRQKSMKKDMPEYIQAYYGNDVAIAAAMKVTPAEVREVVSLDPHLLDLMEIADTSQESLLLDRMQFLAMNSNSPAACRWVLERKYPEKYGKTPAAAKAKSSGFTAPTEEPEDLESVLGTPTTQIMEE